MMMSVPVMSEGIRSGVNWIRRYSMFSDRASVRAIKVLPSPGTPIISACPRQSSVTSSMSITLSWPTTSLAISLLSCTRAARSRSTASWSATGAGGGLGG